MGGRWLVVGAPSSNASFVRRVDISLNSANIYCAECDNPGLRKIPMSQIKLYLFGPPRLERDGRPIDIPLRKALALLVYLAVTRQAHSRDALATLFWPEKDQQAARANLRRTLFDLGQLLGG